MDSQDLAVSLAACCISPVIWLLCGALIGLGRQAWNSILRKIDGSNTSTTSKIPLLSMSSIVSFVISLIFESTAVVGDAMLNIIRTALGYIPLVLFFVLFSLASLLFLRYNAEIILIVDTAYEIFRPNIIETVLHALNFLRVTFAILIGVWNATIDLLMIPIRVVLEAGYKCTGSAVFVRIANTAAAMAKEFASVLVELFKNWKDADTFDTDVTRLSFLTRKFAHVFTEIIECTCGKVGDVATRDVTMAIGYPLFSNTTDTLVNNMTRSVLKAVQIPYKAATTAKTSFEPLFELVLGEDTGVLAAAAMLANEYFDSVANFTQLTIQLEDNRFSAPPVFSLLHRATALPIQLLRVVINTVGALPVLFAGSGEEAADKCFHTTSVHEAQRHFDGFFDILFNDVIGSIHRSLRPYCAVFTSVTQLISESVELTYNFTRDAAVGISTSSTNIIVGKRKNTTIKDTSGCTIEQKFSTNAVERVQYAIASMSEQYSSLIVPLQIEAAETFRDMVAQQFLMTALAESSYTGALGFIRFIESLAKTATYMQDALLRHDHISLFCLQDFQAPVWEKMNDFFTSLPNIFTSAFAFSDTNDSGYANLVCARSTHINHVYSGSLKAYIFASNGCRAVYTKSNVFPKCSYRHENSTIQAMMCSKLLAFADYNTNPFCAIGDFWAGIGHNWVTDMRTLSEYQMGMQIAVWNCLAKRDELADANAWIACASEISEEMIPSTTVYDLMECQTAEVVYRLSVIAVSMWTPLFDAVYDKLSYPSDGYYVSSGDEYRLNHKQARPLEAAFTTLLTAAGGVIFYPVHLFADNSRALTTKMTYMISEGSPDPFIFHKYRREVMVNSLRSTILFWRDILVALMQFMRAADTIENYRTQLNACKVDELEHKCADPKKVSDKFKEIQEVVIVLVAMIQDFVELVSVKFIEGMEAFFSLMNTLLAGFLNQENRAEKIAQFFDDLFHELSAVFVDLLKGFFSLMVQEVKVGKVNVNPFRFIFCDVLGTLKNGVCGFINLKFIPQKFIVKCMGRNDVYNKDGTLRERGGCTWLPSGEMKFFDDEKVHSETNTGVHRRNEAIPDDFSTADDFNIGIGVSAKPIRVISRDPVVAQNSLGFTWNSMYGEFITTSEDRFTKDNRKIADDQYTSLTYDNTNSEAQADYLGYCPLVTAIDQCEEFDYSTDQDVNLGAREYWGNMRTRCEKKKRCDTPDFYANYLDNLAPSCLEYTHACEWIPDPGPPLRTGIELGIGEWLQKTPGKDNSTRNVDFAKYTSFLFAVNDRGNGMIDLIDLLSEENYVAWHRSGDTRAVNFLTQDMETQVYRGTCSSYARSSSSIYRRGISSIETGQINLGGEIVEGFTKVMHTSTTPGSSVGGIGGHQNMFPECYMRNWSTDWGPVPTILHGLETNNKEPSPASGRKLLESTDLFLRAMEETDPIARRKLFGSGAKSDFKKVGNFLEDSAEGAEDEVNKLANLAVSVANSAKDIANSAADAVEKVANDAANVVTDIVDWVEATVNKIKESIPTGGFSIKATSIAGVSGISADHLVKMQCKRWEGGTFDDDGVLVGGTLVNGRDGLEECYKQEDVERNSQEPTVCNSDTDCDAENNPATSKDETAFCWTPIPALCKTPDFEEEAKDWAQSCACGQLMDKKYHCNFGSGFCQAGSTPFREPLENCRDAGGLVAGSDGYNRLCYISPVWMCANERNATKCRERQIGNEINLQGPSLCRSFCDPTFENRNNHLAEYRFSEGVVQCVCEIGVDRVFPDAVKAFPNFEEGTSHANQIDITAQFQDAFKQVHTITGRRKILAVMANQTSLFTSCTSASHCAPSFDNPTLCRSLWGEPIPCYSCSERVHGSASTGYRCSAEEKECMCSVDRAVDFGDPSLVDVGEWRGNSWCDKIMRGYKTAAVRTPLERVWIHRCAVMKSLGQTVIGILGLPTIPPDILYNPSRIVSIIGDTIEGLGVYYSEGYDGSSDERRLEFFNRLIERRIDPLITLTALNTLLKITDALSILWNQLDSTAAVHSVLGRLNPEAQTYFDEGINKTSDMVDGIIRIVSDTDIAALVKGVASSAATITNLTKIIMENTTARITSKPPPPPPPEYAAYEDEDESLVVASVTEDAEGPTRKLLQVANCEIISNIRDRSLEVGKFLTTYYATEGEYLDATFCSFDHFFGVQESVSCNKTRGQSVSQGIVVEDELSFLADVEIDSTISIDSLLQIVNRVEKWFQVLDMDSLVITMVGISETLTGAFLNCDPEIILCNKRKSTLASALFTVQVVAFLIFAGFSMMGFSGLGVGVFFAMQMTFMLPAVLYLAYSYHALCIPRLPVCLGDDMFEVALAMFPPHVMWPPEIVSDEQRSPFSDDMFPWLKLLDKDTHITDCREHNFESFFDAYFWFRAYARVNIFGAVDWPLIRFSTAARQADQRWRVIELSPVINQCGLVNAPGVFPPLVLAFFFYVALSFIGFPAVRLCAQVCVGVIPNAQKALLSILDVYNHGH